MKQLFMAMLILAASMIAGDLQAAPKKEAKEAKAPQATEAPAKVKKEKAPKEEKVKAKKAKDANKVQCSEMTKKGTQCLRMTSSPNGKCWQHGGDKK